MKLTDIIRLLILSAIWGASFLFMRIIAPVLGSIPTAFFRGFFAMAGLFFLLFLLRTRWDFKGKLRPVLALGVINSAIPFAMYSIAARVLPAGYSSILNATAPLMGVVIGALFFAEKITLSKALGVVLGISGVIVLTRTGPVEMTPGVIVGAGACLVATACYGLAGFLTRRWIVEQGGLDSKLVAMGSQLGATVVLFPVFVVSSVLHPMANWGGSGVWFAMAALGLICTALAYILYFQLIVNIGPVKSLMVTFLIPLFGVLWGALFLGEQISQAHAIGGVLIASAVFVVLRPARSS
jgi:drug/metabolite transporter (DMT)-like permease